MDKRLTLSLIMARNERGCGSGQIFKIPRDASVAAAPGQGSPDDPAPGDARESFLGVRALSDFNPSNK